MKLRTIRTDEREYAAFLNDYRARGGRLQADVELLVREIIERVRNGGDAAMRELTEKYDGHCQIEVPAELILGAGRNVPPEIMASLQKAYQRIEAFHQRQLQQSWLQSEDGAILGQIVRPLQRVGIYVPGGKAVYPSSVLMNAIPARVAGVEEIIMATPSTAAGIAPVILAAAELCGINKIFQIGGAQAIAALAYGTESVPRVDKIVGPGNIYVATAKKIVFGDVDIDMIAGPSEIIIVSDGTGSPAWAAADMLSQAEHDELAAAVLITTDEGFARRVAAELQRQLDELPKKQIAKRALLAGGALIITRTLREAVGVANELAPEHLELFVHNPWDVLPLVRNAGAVFMGYHAAEPLGDYIAGPNHVLPTGGTARFSSALGVDDFIKKTSLLYFSPAGIQGLGQEVIRLARSEDLEAHARSVAQRLDQDTGAV